MTELAENLSFADSFATLYFLYGRGCAACEAASPELDKFEKAHRNVLVLRLEAAGSIAARLGYEVKATPTYVLKTGSGETKATSGALTAKQIEKWIGGKR